MDLSKAFDTLDDSLLLEKLSAYCFDNNSLWFVQSYITSGSQSCKIGNDFSGLCKTTTSVPLFLDLFSLIFLSMTFSYSLRVQSL